MEDNVKRALRRIDNDLDEGYRYSVFRGYLTKDEKDLVIKKCKEKRWVKSMTAYNSVMENGEKVVIFLFHPEDITHMIKFYKIIE